MAAGLGLLRLPPAQFWAMTQRELAAALRSMTASEVASPLPRQSLDELRAQFPDTRNPQPHG